MLLNLAIVVLIAMFLARVFEKIKLPPLLGMIAAGVILGPYSRQALGVSSKFLDTVFISEDLIKLSSELRTAALIIILIRAGLGINKKTLNKIGKQAVKMSFIPGILEGTVLIFVGHKLLGIPLVEAGVLAFIIAAVSPAVIVPQMLDLKSKGYGKKKEIPTLILAGASVDDVFAITIFGAFLSLALGERESMVKLFLKIPTSIFCGIVLGVMFGFLLLKFYEKQHIRESKKVIIFMIIAILFNHLETLHIIPIASLLGIMAMGFVILEKNEELAKRLASKFNKIWVLAEILLFVLIGAAVNISVVLDAGLVGLAIIFIGLIGRSIGVWLSLVGSQLSKKEIWFCTIAYIPKATVQAAIGAIPLSMGVASGELILAIAVLSIIVTAPLGAIGIKYSADKFLDIHE